MLCMHRVMLVAVQVSSMNTSRSGSRSSWPSNQACLWLRTSGRSCSIAWPVLFCALCRGARRSDGGSRSPQPGRPRANDARSSSSVMSLQAPHMAKTSTRRSSIRPEHGSRPEASAQNSRSCDAALAIGSPSTAPPQTVPPPTGNSFPHQSRTKAAFVNPSREADPSMLASVLQPVF